MKESFEDGAVVSHVAQRHGLSPQQLFGWRREIRELVLCKPELEGTGVAKDMDFVPVAVANDRIYGDPPMPRTRGSARERQCGDCSAPDATCFLVISTKNRSTASSQDA